MGRRGLVRWGGGTVGEMCEGGSGEERVGDV